MCAGKSKRWELIRKPFYRNLYKIYWRYNFYWLHCRNTSEAFLALSLLRKGLTINCTNEFVQSHFSDGVLILRYISKMGTNGGSGVVVVSALRRCKPYWSRVEIPTGCKSFFSLIFVYKLTSTNSYILWRLYQFVHFYVIFVYKLISTNTYNDVCTNSYIFMW